MLDDPNSKYCRPIICVITLEVTQLIGPHTSMLQMDRQHIAEVFAVLAAWRVTAHCYADDASLGHFLTFMLYSIFKRASPISTQPKT